MPSPVYGPAVAILRPDYLAPDDFVTSIFTTMIRHYVSEFNITPADDFALVVFRRRADCERFCRVTGLSIEADDVRYFAGRTMLT